MPRQLNMFLFLPLLAAVLSVLTQHAAASAISAFYSKDLPAPQVMMYEKGKIYYSLCNSEEIPIFAYDDTVTLPLKQKPIENTDIAISAGKDGVAFIHYQDEGGGIVQAKVTCDTGTGHWTMEDGDSVIVSGGKPVILPGLIMPRTPLAVLSSPAGNHQIFYKDHRNTPSILEYRPGSNGDELSGTWLDGRWLTQDLTTGPAIGAVMLGNEVRVVMPRNDNISLEIAVHTPDSKKWDIYFTGYSITDNQGEYITNNTRPSEYDQGDVGSSSTKLEGFSNATDIGVATVLQKGRDTTLASIFFTGEDYRIHNVVGVTDIWDIGTYQPPHIWPPTDSVNARLGVTSNLNTEDVWIYYMSGGKMTQVYMKNGEWQPFVALKKPDPTIPGTSTNSTLTGHPSPKTFPDPMDSIGSGSNTQEATTKQGFSQTQRLHIGLGAGVGAAVLLGLVACYVLFSAKRSKKKRDHEHGAAKDRGACSATGGKAASTLGTSQSPAISPVPGYVDLHRGDNPGQWVNGQWVSFDAHLAKQWGEWHLQQYQQCFQQQQQHEHHRNLHELQENAFDPEPQELSTGQSVQDTFDESPVLGKGKDPERTTSSLVLSPKVTSPSDEETTPWPTPYTCGTWLRRWSKKAA